MIPPTAQAQLDMLRRAPRAVAHGPTKRPHGGRPNPCAAAAIPTDDSPCSSLQPAAGPPARRVPRGMARPDHAPPWRRLVAAVAAGRLPVGVPLRTAALRAARVASLGGSTCPDMIAMELVSHRAPVRLRQIDAVTWRIDLV